MRLSLGLKYHNQIPYYSYYEEQAQCDQTAPPEIFLPVFHFEVFQNNNSQEKSDSGSSNVSHVAHLETLYISRYSGGQSCHLGDRVGVVPTVDGDTDVHARHHQEGGKSQAGKLHLCPVGDDVGKVGGNQGVDPTTGPGKVDGGVREGDQEGAGHHTTGGHCQTSLPHLSPQCHGGGEVNKGICMFCKILFPEIN